MGPLVPEFLNEEMNLVLAFLIGIAFGFILEQAGFSSSKRLAGVFYGYDFTVLRVFFTAGVTAVLGLAFLDRMALIDLSMVYVNPTFLWPAIVGGAIMGVGFILGGYCPGTSIAAAAIGKKDAMMFVLGGLGGVFVFAEIYPSVSEFFLSGALGPQKVYDALGVSQGAFILLLTVVAVGAFIATTMIQKRVTKESIIERFVPLRHKIAGALTIVIAIVFALLPDYKGELFAEAEKAVAADEVKVSYIDSDELAYRLINKDKKLSIIDVRAPAVSKSFTLPSTVAIPTEGFLSKEWNTILRRDDMKKVIISSDETEAKRAAFLADKLDITNIYILKGGIHQFQALYFPEHSAIAKVANEREEVMRFRTKAAVLLTAMLKEEQAKGSAKPKTVKKVKGGC